MVASGPFLVLTGGARHSLPKTMLLVAHFTEKAQLSAIVASYHTSLQQWVCESLMFPRLNYR